MFGGIKKRWREARTDVMRKELEDALVRIEHMSDKMRENIAGVMAGTYRSLIAQYGLIENVSNRTKGDIARALQKKSKEIFDTNISAAYGGSLLSLYFESLAHDGESAEFVRLTTQELLDIALSTFPADGTPNVGRDQGDDSNSEVPNVVDEHLHAMGYELTPYGAGVTILELGSGYSPVKVASHIAHTTLALDVREAGNNITNLMSFLPHRQTLLEVLKEYKDSGELDEETWRNDTNAIFHITNVDEHTNEWIEKILNDPIAGKKRLATRIS